VNEHVTGLTQELARFERTLEEENKNKGKLLAIIRTVRAWVGQDIPLDASSLGQGFNEITQAYIDSSCNLVTMEGNGKVTRRPLEGVPPELFLVVAWEIAPSLLHLVSAKTESVVGSRKPSITASIAHDGNGFHFPGNSKVRLVLLNSGGDACDIRVKLRRVRGSSSPGQIVTYEKATLARNMQRELDPGQLKEDEEAKLYLELSCKDVDGRGYEGQEEIDVTCGQPKEIRLVRNHN